MDVSDDVWQLASLFSADVLKIVYIYRNQPFSVFAYCSSYGNVGILVISLIKGELRNHFCENASRVLERATTDDEVNDVLMRVPRLYVREHPQEYMTILKAIAFTAMYSIFYRLRNVGPAQYYAHNAVTHMLLSLEDGHFVQRGGLALLSNYAGHILSNQGEYFRVFEQGTYPW